ncbi:sensor histidine kinase [Methyloraptor flagellatus]|uniref:histidine kinase n=1 Tax=Methyloraptor flagellatus TaxID=3162530 RepID=A0AAU7XFK0_9HYPH
MWHLAAAVEDWRGLLGASGDIVLAIDADRAIVFANRRFEQTFGPAEPDLRGQPIDAVLARFRAAEPAEPGEVDASLLLLQTCVGPRRFAVAETGVPDPVAGGPVASVVLTDVTERLEAEAMLRRARDEAEAASAAKSRFLALASHEIRTPLNGIIGMADLLADSPLSPAQSNYVRAVHSSGTSLLSLVDDVLDLAKVEAGRLDLAEAPVDLGALVEEVVELLAPRAHGKGIELVGRIAPDVPAEVMADAARLRQVLINLVGNAVKFTHSGGVTIEIGRRADAVPGFARIAVAVHDTGIGVPAADAERIFREFEQVEQGPARRYGGTGLGLAIARQIVDRMGGRIELDSREGCGSTFRFAVDLGIVAEAPPRPSISPVAALRSSRALRSKPRYWSNA